MLLCASCEKRNAALENRSVAIDARIWRTRKHNAIWGDIAAQMQETDIRYTVTGFQCSTKLHDQNKKSGNSHSSWAFYSVSICICVCINIICICVYIYRLTKQIL